MITPEAMILVTIARTTPKTMGQLTVENVIVSNSNIIHVSHAYMSLEVLWLE